jgi:hypothetical protein
MLILGCAGTKSPDPISPSTSSANPNFLTQAANPDTNNHFLWSYQLVYIDPATTTTEILPVRLVSTHYNILQWLEQKPCANCLKIKNIHPSGIGTILCDIEIKHPFPSPILTGFDVRGIAMFTGSHSFPVSGLNISDKSLGDAELVNADGYSSLYNISTQGSGPGGLQGYMKGKLSTTAPPNALLNGFKRFVSNKPANTRNAFYAGETISVTYEIAMPSGPFVFGYAVDGCWAPPITKPVIDPMTDFPISANCPEPWAITVTDIGSTPSQGGGSVELQIDVFDWQGKDSHDAPLVECPEVFDGAVPAVFQGDISGGSRWTATISNSKMTAGGEYRVLVSVKDHAQDPSKPWMDLRAFQVCRVDVPGAPSNMVDVTPLFLRQFSIVKMCRIQQYLVVAGKEGLYIFDASKPSPIRPVNFVDYPGNPTPISMATHGNYVFIGNDNYEGITVWDFANPESPQLIKVVSLPGANPLDILVDNTGDYAYVAAKDKGVRVIDINPINSSSQIKAVDLDIQARYLTMADGYLIAGSGGSDLASINITLPPDAWEIDSTEISYGSCWILGMAASSNHIFPVICKYDDYNYDYDVSMTTVEINSEGSLTWKEFSGIELSSGLGLMPEDLQVVASGDHFYVQLGNVFCIVDISIPDSPTKAFYVTAGLEVDLALVDFGEFVILGTVDLVKTVPLYMLSAITIDKTSSPWSAAPGFKIEIPDDGDTVISQSGFLYATRNMGGSFDIFDAHAPEQTSFVNKSSLGYAGAGMDVKDHYVYLVDDDDGGYDDLLILDVSDPYNPEKILSVPGSGGQLGQVCVESGYAYVEDNYGKLDIFDVDPAESAHLVNSVDLSETYITALAASGTYVYVSSIPSYNPQDAALDIIDVAVPASASVVKTLTFDTEMSDMKAMNGYLYAVIDSGPNYGLNIIDVDPVETASVIKVVGDAHGTGIDLQGIYAYVASEDWLYAVQIDPPASAAIVGSLEVGCKDIVVDGKYAFITAESFLVPPLKVYGLGVIKLY